MASKAVSISSNTLITNKASEGTLNVQLHPLVLLTITDYITRHTSRRQDWPIIGAIIGQQNGRSITLEHAYECKISSDNSLDAEWFSERLEQYRDVHKAPALDLVAIFMLGAANDGPSEAHARVVEQVQKLTGGEGLMLLLFHPEMVEALQGGKLPISLYESVVEQQEGGTGDAQLKFRELAFEVEAGEAEMIGVDSVATGSGNATAVPKAPVEAIATSAAPATLQSESSTSGAAEKKKGKGKGKAKDKDAAETSSTNILSPEDEELLASLTAKVNAIKMLAQRLNLIHAYLKSQPSSYLTDATSTTIPPETTTNHTLLRSINAMLSRLPLLAPPTTTAPLPTTQTPTPTTSQAQPSDDVHLTTLLATLTRSIYEAQSLGSKFHTVTREKANKERGPFGGGGGGGGLGNRGAGRNPLGFGDESILLSAGDHSGGV